MQVENLIPADRERHNALMSYGFIAPLLLLSREPQFRDPFVRAHAKYASLIHLIFVLFIVILVRSANFSSMFLFDHTWVNTVFLGVFLALLWFLGFGAYNAYKGKKPRWSWKDREVKNLASEKTSVEKSHEIPLILGHIPFVGTYFSRIYGGLFTFCEKYSNWFFVIAILALWIDPSFTIFVILFVANIAWLVYQSIHVSTNYTLTLLGKQFPSSRDMHVFLRALASYTKNLLHSNSQIPKWSETYAVYKGEYRETKIETKDMQLIFPIISLGKAFKVKENRVGSYQSILISIITTYALTTLHIYLIALLALTVWHLYHVVKKDGDILLPIIGDIALVIEKAVIWKEKRSHTTTIQYKQ